MKGLGLWRLSFLPFMVAFLVGLAWPASSFAREEKGQLRQEAVFEASFEEAWTAAIEALKKASLPVSDANRERREIVSLKFLSADELYSLAFLPRADLTIRSGLGRLTLTFVPQEKPGRILVKARHEISALAMGVERRTNRFARAGEMDVPVPRFVEGRSFGIVEDALLASMEQILAGERKS